MDKIKIATLLAKEIPASQIYIDEPMKKHTSFKIGGNAEIFVKTKTTKEIESIIDITKKNDIPITIIGNGSNILVKDKGIKGVIIKVELNQLEIGKKENKNEYIVTVGAGYKMGELAQKLLQEELTGFEFASGIPGTIGGAIKMNAGAYGKEMQDIIIETKCINIEENEEKTYIILNNKEHEFSYRHSIFAEKKYVILETKLKLEKGNYSEIKSKMEEYAQSRKEKQPLEMPSAGSTFKRGNDYITAKLIDECGLKGYTIGGAQVSDLHAGFIVNTGDATADDVIQLTQYIKKVVKEKTGKEIELEIEIIGE